MSVKPIKQGSRKKVNGLPVERQDSLKKYKVSDEMRKKGNLRGRFPIHIPELKMVIYTKYPERAEELRKKYLNRSPFTLPEKTALKEAI